MFMPQGTIDPELHLGGQVSPRGTRSAEPALAHAPPHIPPDVLTRVAVEDVDAATHSPRDFDAVTATYQTKIDAATKVLFDPNRRDFAAFFVIFGERDVVLYNSRPALPTATAAAAHRRSATQQSINQANVAPDPIARNAANSHIPRHPNEPSGDLLCKLVYGTPGSMVTASNGSVRWHRFTLQPTEDFRPSQLGADKDGSPTTQPCSIPPTSSLTSNSAGLGNSLPRGSVASVGSMSKQNRNGQMNGELSHSKQTSTIFPSGTPAGSEGHFAHQPGTVHRTTSELSSLIHHRSSIPAGPGTGFPATPQGKTGHRGQGMETSAFGQTPLTSGLARPTASHPSSAFSNPSSPIPPEYLMENAEATETVLSVVSNWTDSRAGKEHELGLALVIVSTDSEKNCKLKKCPEFLQSCLGGLIGPCFKLAREHINNKSGVCRLMCTEEKAHLAKRLAPTLAWFLQSIQAFLFPPMSVVVCAPMPPSLNTPSAQEPKPSTLQRSSNLSAGGGGGKSHADPAASFMESSIHGPRSPLVACPLDSSLTNLLRHAPLLLTQVVTGAIGLSDLSFLHAEYRSQNRREHTAHQTNDSPGHRRILIFSSDVYLGVQLAVVAAAFFRPRTYRCELLNPTAVSGALTGGDCCGFSFSTGGASSPVTSSSLDLKSLAHAIVVSKALDVESPIQVVPVDCFPSQVLEVYLRSTAASAILKVDVLNFSVERLDIRRDQLFAPLHEGHGQGTTTTGYQANGSSQAQLLNSGPPPATMDVSYATIMPSEWVYDVLTWAEATCPKTSQSTQNEIEAKLRETVYTLPGIPPRSLPGEGIESKRDRRSVVESVLPFQMKWSTLLDTSFDFVYQQSRRFRTSRIPVLPASSLEREILRLKRRCKDQLVKGESPFKVTLETFHESQRRSGQRPMAEVRENMRKRLSSLVGNSTIGGSKASMLGSERAGGDNPHSLGDSESNNGATFPGDRTFTPPPSMLAASASVNSLALTSPSGKAPPSEGLVTTGTVLPLTEPTHIQLRGGAGAFPSAPNSVAAPTTPRTQIPGSSRSVASASGGGSELESHRLELTEKVGVPYLTHTQLLSLVTI
jgi:hypothetical protein